MKFRYRIAIWITAELLLALVCVNLTTAGVLTEEYAESYHATIATVIFLWASGFLRCPQWTAAATA